MTLPAVGAISIFVLESLRVIQPGRAVPPVKVTVVKAPVVAQLLAVHERIAGLIVYAFEATDGSGRVTSVVAPTAAF